MRGSCFFFQAEDGIRDKLVTGVQTCALPISQNVHGERVQKLDLFAHQTISRVLGSTGQLAVMASEEDENIIPVPKDVPFGRYVVNFDPLDGSSNINAGVNIGTIFSVLPRVTAGGSGQLEDCLQPGIRQVC